MKRVAVIVLALTTLGTICDACSMVTGRFHQVTALRGRVVGKDLGLFGFAWLRQSFGVRNARLTLYEYPLLVTNREQRKVATTKSDRRGNYDFGLIPKGHYSLVIDIEGSDRMGGYFDVEVTDAVKPTKEITIDVSPIHPDCTGGHEFIETKV